MRFKEFEDEWEVKKLGDVTKKINSGKTPLGGEAVYKTEGILFIRSQNVNNNKLELDNIVFISEETNKAMQNSIVESDDILLNITGASLGRSCVVPKDFKIGNVNQHVCIIRPNENINPRFIQPILSSKKGQDIFNSLQTGSGREGLNFENIRNIKICLPSIIEQNKIASLLTLVDERINTQIKIISKFESLMKATCRDYYKNANKKEYSISELGKPYSVMNLSKGDLSDKGKKCILYGELFTTYKCVIDDVKSFTKYESTISTLSGDNDILFPSSTTVDAISLIAPSAICEKGIILGGDMFGIHLYKEFSNEYISYVINYIYKETLAKYAKGSTIIHLHYSDIKNCKIFLPNFQEQKTLASLLRLISNKIKTEKEIHRLYNQQKQYLLQNLFI